MPSTAGQSNEETDWAAVHPRLVSTIAFQHRLEHMLVRRTSPTDVVAVTIVETTRTTDEGLDEFAAAGLRESLVDCLGANFGAQDSIAITDTGRFAILIETAPSRQHLIDQVRLTATDLSGPHDLGSRAESMSIRAGIAFADDIHRDATVLFRQARRALGLTVAGGIEVFGDDADKANLDKYELIADLARAARDDRLDVAYNPVVGDDGCNSVLMEAQLQWDHVTRGSISPETFMPLADE
ncbi:MAG: EAL domain-containing protein [Actinobacteria bacterium]|nr:EAL domain-containing protein [Actinomycetota bacterium]